MIARRRVSEISLDLASRSSRNKSKQIDSISRFLFLPRRRQSSREYQRYDEDIGRQYWHSARDIHHNGRCGLSQSPYTVLLYKSPPRGGRVLVIQRKIALVSLKADAVSLTGEPDPRERDSLSGKEHPRIKRTTILTDWYTGNTPLVYSCSSRFPRARARARST